ncbi:MAG: VanZ family protein [Propionibacteriaceae bacterium]|nr:VanZ family protein [Propionibacteriaceae bacterium]
MLRRLRVIRWVIVGVWAVVIFTLSAIPARAYPSAPGFLSYVAHFCEYAILGGLLAIAGGGWWVLIGRSEPDLTTTTGAAAGELADPSSLTTLRPPSRLTVWRAVGAVVLASLYGVTDEFHQSFVPGRSPDPKDWMVDTIGAICGVVLVWLAVRYRTRRSRDRLKRPV